jgi:hypothetical protein
MRNEDSIKTKNVREKIKNKSLELINQSSTHGLPKLFRTQRKSIKFMWLLLFIIFSSLGIYMVYKTVSNYLKYEIVTKIEVINEIPTEFPTVTVINLRNIKSKEPLSNFLVWCSFNNQPCDENNFIFNKDKFGHTSYSLKRNKSFIPGSFYGLRLLFHLGRTKQNIVGFDGLQIIVHNHSSSSGYNLGYSEMGLNVGSGFATLLSIKRTFSQRLGEPFNECLKDTVSINSFDSDLYRYIIQSTNYSYNYKDCFEYCIGREMNKYLNISNKIEHWKNVAYTSSDKPFYLFDVYYKIIKDNIHKKCLHECPIECDSIRYDISASFSKFEVKPAIEIIKAIKFKVNPIFENLTSADLNDLVFASVFYNDLEYTSISQLPKMDFFDLISNIGGSLGLFIGISFLSFAEIIELLLEVLCIFSEKSKFRGI